MGMGIGRLGAPNIIIKRKFRWTLRIETPRGTIPEHYVKVAARPQLDIDETEINFLNATTWIPGKGKWQPITVSYIDVAADDVGPLYDWIASVYNFNTQNPSTDLPQTEKIGWNATAILQVYDGCGKALERWKLQSVWPQSVNFGDLDMADSSELTIDLTLRYSEVNYQNLCGPQVVGSCIGC
jgi:hypothetical protein